MSDFITPPLPPSDTLLHSLLEFSGILKEMTWEHIFADLFIYVAEICSECVLVFNTLQLRGDVLMES